MKRTLITIIFLTSWMLAGAQNLVPNPSFEDTIQCPISISQFGSVEEWFQPTTGTTDYFNACCTGLCNAGIPANLMGHQDGNGGNAYAGMILYMGSFLNYREYVEVRLTAPLVSGQKYCVEYLLSLADQSNYSIGSIGAYFSADSIYRLDNSVFSSYTPQVQHHRDSMISDTINWVLISDQFTATGGEKFMTIGNFHQDDSTTYDTTNTSSLSTIAHYYIDNISVIADTGQCSVTTSLHEVNDHNFTIYPNPTSGNVTLEFNNSEQQDCTLSLYDFQGRIVRRVNNITNNKTIVNLNGLVSGLYFFRLFNANQEFFNGKLRIE
jgi:hypothetical protein